MKQSDGKSAGRNCEQALGGRAPVGGNGAHARGSAEHSGNRWNVVRGGVVIAELHADTWHEALELARKDHGIGARPSMPGVLPAQQRRRPAPSWTPPHERTT